MSLRSIQATWEARPIDHVLAGMTPFATPPTTRGPPMHEALNHAKLAMLFRKEFQLCNVQKGEPIVLLSDLGARRDYVSAAFAAAEDFGADVYEMCVNAMPSWTKVGVETVGRCKG